MFSAKQSKALYGFFLYPFLISICVLPKQFPGNPQFLAPPKRAHHALVYDEISKCILLTAGSTPLNEGSSFEFYNDSWCYDGSNWKEGSASGDKRSGIQLAYDCKRGKIFSFGGFSGENNQSLGDLRVLENGEWKTHSQHPEIKVAEAGLVYDKARDRLIVYGGSPARGEMNHDTWEWDGDKWIKIETNSPGGRQAFAMVYDSKRNRTVLFGGMSTTPGKPYGDTWEFDGKAWTLVAESGPGERLSPGFAYDSKRGMMILFGGIHKGKMMGDTWGWDGKEWNKLADTGPAARVMGYMAYDSSRDRVVLFGGRLGWPNDTNDTWEWNGEKWEQK